MATIMLIFLVALGLAAMLGWTTDTRDGADWKPDDDRLLRERRVSNLQRCSPSFRRPTRGL